jgi:flagellar hook protein FlgE
MSLFGAMVSGISALNAHSQSLGIISDNISNVNTVGYKASDTRFSSLVTSQASTSSYSPGGVRPNPITFVEKQGLLQVSDSSTDVALNGEGMIVVTNVPTKTSGTEYLFTRAGSFTTDKNGNLVNTAGYYLQGWKTDNNGVPSTTNLSILTGLETVNINGLSGNATATTKVGLDANLPATAPAATAQQMTVQVFDALGVGHNITLTFTKTATLNQWTMIASNPTLATNSTVTTGTTAFGPATVVFNSDGSFSSSSDLTLDVTGWTTGASNSAITLDLGTANKTDGLTQYSDKFIVRGYEQNGVPYGFFKGISISEDGLVMAEFDNGQKQKIFKVPVATFANPNGLTARNGNAFVESDRSGSYILQSAGTGGSAKYAPSSLEGSTVDLANEFTDMIVTQRAYSATSRVISTADQMMEELIRIGQ